MEKLNLHGLTIKGLKKASSETEDYGSYSGRYNEIFYDRATGEVWTVFQYSLQQNFWTEYHDPDIIKIGNTTSHLTMQQLADMIAEKICLHNEADRVAEEERRGQKAWEEKIER